MAAAAFFGNLELAPVVTGPVPRPRLSLTRVAYHAEMISGAHVVLYSSDAEADRAFLRDVLGWSCVDAGAGWLIFAAPPTEVAVHPSDGQAGSHELMLMCDDLDETVAALRRFAVTPTRPVEQTRWGRITAIRLPGGGELSLYQPHHPRPH